VCAPYNRWNGKWNPDRACSIRKDICAPRATIANQDGSLPAGDYDEKLPFTCNLGYRPIPSDGMAKCSYYGKENGQEIFKWSLFYCVAAAGY
jgi:hypothetical protein